jgi:hypothetical protein
MGALVAIQAVPDVQNELNQRFAPGDALKEIAALHKEFKIFTGDHDLKSIVQLLNLEPRDTTQREGWFKFLDGLKTMKSDTKGMSAHDRAIMAIKEDLERGKPLPIFFTWHPSDESTALIVTEEPAFFFSKTKFLIISGPIAKSDRKRGPGKGTS